MIGLGPEFTGGKYGRDDFDLLKALGTQAASALLAARMVEEVSKNRQIETWNALSAFVLHDVKNAANMLSLLRTNADQHIGNPEFQKDMLKAIDSALNRMNKIHDRLGAFKRDIVPSFEDLNLSLILNESCQILLRKMPTLKLSISCNRDIQINSDREILAQIMDNLFLNAMEAGGEQTEIKIIGGRGEDHQSTIEMIDDGPGISPELLPDALFEPFKTTKPRGTGIGLWQVKWMLKRLGGSITAENVREGGAKFTIKVPLINRGGGV